MHTLVEPLEGNKVKLSIQVDEQEFEKAVDAAFRKIAREVRVPGFRPGKAPRRILEARLGREAGRQEALRDALPDYYVQALKEHDVDAIAPPAIDITAGEQSGSVSFDAVVEIRPQLRLAGYSGLQVKVPRPFANDSDIDGQIDRLRNNFAELEEVDRPAALGDNVTIDIEGTRDGEAVGGLSVKDFMYEIGSAAVVPELDEKLPGVSAGDTVTFDATMPDGAVELKVVVKDVKAKVLPEVTDEWASEASEFDSVSELKQDLTKRSQAYKLLQAQMALRSGAIEALVELVDVDVPEALVNAEVERRVHELSHRLESQGANLAQYMAATGQTQEALLLELRESATATVKADLALRSVADSEEVEVTEGDIDDEIGRMAAAYETKPLQLRRELERADQMGAVRSDLRKGKALEWLLDHVEVIDEDGNPVDRSILSAEQPGSGPPQLSSSQVDHTTADSEAADSEAADSEAASKGAADEGNSVVGDKGQPVVGDKGQPVVGDEGHPVVGDEAAGDAG